MFSIASTQLVISRVVHKDFFQIVFLLRFFCFFLDNARLSELKPFLILNVAHLSNASVGFSFSVKCTAT